MNDKPENAEQLPTSVVTLSERTGPSSRSSETSFSPRATGFDLNALRFTRNVGEGFAVKRHITRVPVRKPTKGDFFRTHPDPGWRFQTMILERKDEGETYLLAPGAWDILPELQRPAMLCTAIDRRGNPFLIPIPLPGEDGRRNQWHDSLAAVVALSEKKWVRSVANMSIGGYDAHVAIGQLPEPEWPALRFEQLMEIAFRGRIVESEEHPLIRQLLGEI